VGLEFEACSGRVIGAAVAVHSALGSGFLEGVYQRALEMELDAQRIRFERQLKVEVRYRGQVVGVHRLDFLVEDVVVVELKAASAIIDAHLAQLRSYLKATDIRVGLLLNFNAPVLGIRRVVN
jgi:GxxExxY protein